MTPNADDYTVSAAVNIVGDIFLAISGNGGFGFPGRVYFTYRDRDTGQWSTPQLVTGSNSATNASIALGFGNRAFIASCGVSGNIYDGNVYLSSDTSGSFETSLLGSYISVTRAVVANIISEFGVVIFDAPIGGDQESNIELVYYGPDIPSTGIDRTVPAPSNPSYCYPNPFNAQTVINYSLPEEAFISITIYNINGQKLEVIFDGKDPAGEHSVRWNASDYPSGIYFAQLKSGNRSENIKMVLLK
jgi:hypothetical protein